MFKVPTPEGRGPAPYVAAIIYKVFEDPMYAGIYIFSDEGTRRMGFVSYDNDERKEGTWKFKED